MRAKSHDHRYNHESGDAMGLGGVRYSSTEELQPKDIETHLGKEVDKKSNTFGHCIVKRNFG